MGISTPLSTRLLFVPAECVSASYKCIYGMLLLKDVCTLLWAFSTPSSTFQLTKGLLQECQSPLKAIDQNRIGWRFVVELPELIDLWWCDNEAPCLDWK